MGQLKRFVLLFWKCLDGWVICDPAIFYAGLRLKKQNDRGGLFIL